VLIFALVISVAGLLLVLAAVIAKLIYARPIGWLDVSALVSAVGLVFMISCLILKKSDS
jgi:hypothetical protein